MNWHAGAAVQPPEEVSAGLPMQAASVSSPPAGFKTVIRSTPRPGADGVIRGDSPLTVEFDACGSTADEGKTLFFYFDWDFDNVGDAGGTGAACKQEHTYRSRVAQKPGAETLRTNVCIANADIGEHNPKTFVSCRQFAVALPERQNAFCHSITAPNGCPTGATQFCESEPIQASNSAHALDACQACFGQNGCGSGNAGSGQVWLDQSFGPNFAAFFYTDANVNFACPPATPFSVAGDISDFGACPIGRWAP